VALGRIFNAVLLAVMVTGAAITYTMKHNAEAMANHVVQLAASIAKERETIATLKAEWSMLVQPGRLQNVISHYADHFQLEPFSADQVATLAEIPEKAVATDQPGGKKALAAADLARIIKQAQR
jgi:cell division protein FtsL